MPLYPSIFFFFKFLYQILFSYICYQIIRLVGLFGIGEPERKVEFQTEMFLYVFFRSIFRQPGSFWTLLYIKNTDRTVFMWQKYKYPVTKTKGKANNASCRQKSFNKMYYSLFPMRSNM